MRIWFELTNSPHINMFAAMIRELEREHEVVITCRPLANTVELLDLHGFNYTVVGKHYGGQLSAKLFGFPVRVYQLCRFLSGKKIDVAISQSSLIASSSASSAGASSMAQGRAPRPPALETATARALPCTPAIGACRMGRSMPSSDCKDMAAARRVTAQVGWCLGRNARTPRPRHRR